MSNSLQQKTFSGLLWTFAENFSLQGFGFIQGVILARLLMPSDYGLIAMVGIFFAVSGCFIDSGFTTALIQKKNRTAIDYSTVYVTNVCLSFLFAVLLCLCSSAIAHFYKEPILQKIVCINALSLFLGSFLAVQGTRLTINLDFKTKSIIHVTSTVITGVATIILALLGYGVWSLIYPTFIALPIKALLYWHYQHWFPGFAFSFQSCKEFFSFGSKLLISGLLDTLYHNIYPIIIGKKFSATDLGYYTRANGYASLPSTTVTGMLSRVTFPVLCEIQDDENRLEQVYRRLLRLSAYIVFPCMVGLAALTKPLIITLITEKWANSIVYLQILCFALMWYPIHAINLNLLQVKGRSDLFLRLEVIKKIIGVCILCISIPLGLIYMCIGQIFSSIICLTVNTYYTGKLINVGFLMQMRDLLPTLFYSFSMGIIVWICTQFISSLYLQIIVGILVGVTYYITISWINKSSELDYIILLLKQNVFNKNAQ